MWITEPRMQLISKCPSIVFVSIFGLISNALSYFNENVKQDLFLWVLSNNKSIRDQIMVWRRTDGKPKSEPITSIYWRIFAKLNGLNVVVLVFKCWTQDQWIASMTFLPAFLKWQSRPVASHGRLRLQWSLTLSAFNYEMDKNLDLCPCTDICYFLFCNGNFFSNILDNTRAIL